MSDAIVMDVENQLHSAGRKLLQAVENINWQTDKHLAKVSIDRAAAAYKVALKQRRRAMGVKINAKYPNVIAKVYISNIKKGIYQDNVYDTVNP
jgi:hypothetical protein